jgi:hypothetical protein
MAAAQQQRSEATAPGALAETVSAAGAPLLGPVVDATSPPVAGPADAGNQPLG